MDQTRIPSAVAASKRVRDPLRTWRTKRHRVAQRIDASGRAGEPAFHGTTPVFGTPPDVGLAEPALECCFPANAETAAATRERVAAA